MKMSTILKINFLILILVVVFMVMNRLETQGLGSSFLTVMGLGSQGTAGKQVTWCDTRVTSVEMAGLKLIQEGLKWFVETETRAEADFVSVEKWFGRHCTLDINPVGLDSLDLKKFDPLLTVSFVKGPQQQVLRSGEGIYLWQNQAFRSSELDEALKTLPDLPQRAIQ